MMQSHSVYLDHGSTPECMAVFPAHPAPELQVEMQHCTPRQGDMGGRSVEASGALAA